MSLCTPPFNTVRTVGHLTKTSSLYSVPLDVAAASTSGFDQKTRSTKNHAASKHRPPPSLVKLSRCPALFTQHKQRTAATDSHSVPRKITTARWVFSQENGNRISEATKFRDGVDAAGRCDSQGRKKSVAACSRRRSSSLVKSPALRTAKPVACHSVVALLPQPPARPLRRDPARRRRRGVLAPR